MPVDQWRKAAMRAKYGPVSYSRKREGPGKSKRERKADKRARERMKDPAVVASRFSANSMLWFGCHKGKPIKEIPGDYLKWIISTHVANKGWWRMDGLVLFLRRWLKGEAS